MIRVETGLPHLSSEVPEISRRAEELGFDGLVAVETAHEPFLPLALAAEHTSKATLRTGLAIAFPRSPHVVANVCWDLQEFSKGRFILGLGPQVKGHNERRFNSGWPGPPAPRLKEYVQAVRAFLNCWGKGEPLNFQGEYYNHTLMTFNFTPQHHEYWETPIYISALGPAMARVAGEVADGIMLHPMASNKFINDILLPNIEVGLKRSGRTMNDIEIQGGSFAVTGDTPEELEASRRGVARSISFYGSTRTYQRALDLHGFKELNLQLHEMSKQNRWDEMHELITDDVVEALADVGTVEEVARAKRKQFAGMRYATSVNLPDMNDAAAVERTKNLIQIYRGEVD